MTLIAIVALVHHYFNCSAWVLGLFMVHLQTLWTWQWILGSHVPHQQIVDKDMLEHHLHKLNAEYYKQAQRTPFTVASLSELFREYTETEFSDKFWNGEVDIDAIDGISEYTKQFLKELSPSPHNPPPVDTHFTAQDVHDGFFIWKECTSTSLMGQHLGLYKAWTMKNYVNNDHILPKLELYQVIATIINIATAAQYLLHSWLV
eukprot:11472562-Ditylum_brightwellii.AAC.1